MGIHTEYNPDLALRDICEYRRGKRKKEECLPEKLEKERDYCFLKEGQRSYWLEGEIPLLKTDGNQRLSNPIASIIILNATHFMLKGKVWTKGEYRVTEVFNSTDNNIHFNGFKKINA